MLGSELYWLAGLLEGEGCFSIQKYPNRAPLARIRLAMTDFDVVLRAGRLIGGKQRTPAEWQKKGTTYKTIYNWSVTGREAVRLMRILLPLMGSRRADRITEILNLPSARQVPRDD